MVGSVLFIFGKEGTKSGPREKLTHGFQFSSKPTRPTDLLPVPVGCPTGYRWQKGVAQSAGGSPNLGHFVLSMTEGGTRHTRKVFKPTLSGDK